MALPTRFAALTQATGLELDNDFDAVGALTTVQCTASGTNLISLTPQANAPVVTAYGLPYPVRFGFTASATSTNTVTARVGSLAALKVFLPSGSQATTGDISSGAYYEIVYLSALDSGNGGWIVVSALPATSTTPAATGSMRGLKIVNNSGTPNTEIDITATRVIASTSTGSPIFISSASVTIDLTTTGANGMDTGARPSNGWVYLYLISTGSVTAGLASATSPTAGNPTFPASYVYSVYVGAMYCDGSQNLRRTRQLGRDVQYVVPIDGASATLPVMDSGAKGTYSISAPVWQSITVTSYVPLTASIINVVLDANWTGAAGGAIIVAPNASYAGFGNSTGAVPGAVVAGNSCTLVPLVLEATTIQWASSAAPAAIFAAGWRDYYTP